MSGGSKYDEPRTRGSKYDERPRRGVPPASALPRKRTMADEAMGVLTNLNSFIPGGDELADGAQAVVNAATGRSRGLAQGWRDARSASRNAAQDFEQRRPIAANLAKGAGSAATLLIPGGAAAQTSRLGAAAAGAASASANAGLTAFADRGSLPERAQAAASAMTNPATLALGAGLGGALVPRRELPRKTVSPAVRALAAEGVQMTPGQMRGGIAQRLEDQMASAPILGSAISEARERGVESFNQAAVNQALRPIGERLPSGMPAGREAVAFAQQRLGQEFDSLVPPMGIVPDAQLSADFARIADVAQDMTPAGASQLEKLLGQRITSRIANRQIIDGPLYQQIRSELGTLQGRFSRSPDADQRAISEGLKAAQDALDAAAARQNPQFAEALGNARRGYAALVPVERAAANSTDGGVFTPRQLSTAMRAADNSVRKRATAGNRGGRMDFADAAVEVLPSSIGNSGTADRLGFFGLGGLTVANAPAAALTAGGLFAGRAAYSERAIAAANTALNERISREVRMEALRELGLLAEQNPALRQTYMDISLRLARATGGVAGAQGQPSAARAGTR